MSRRAPDSHPSRGTVPDLRHATVEGGPDEAPLPAPFPAAAGLVAVALAVTTPATVESARPCEGLGCRHGTKDPDVRMGWILSVDADGTGSYWTYAPYPRDDQGHCFDVRGIGVGCPG